MQSGKKEQLVQLLEPKLQIDAIQALESKKEGDFYMKQQKISQVVEAYNTSLDCTASEDIRHKVSLNMCKAFYKLGQADQCIIQAEGILQSSPNDPKAYLWLGLTCLEVERKIDKHSSKKYQEIIKMEE